MHKPINCFPGYEKVIEEINGKKIVHNMYRGTDLGLGGYVYAEPGMYTNVALIDVSNMHGASIIALNKFGKNTQKFADMREANLAIKHKEFDKLKTLMGGALAKYLDDPNTDWKAIRTALKLVSNSTFGVSAATFDNPLRDSRDDNDIIALRGALFMRTLQDEVTDRGFKVAHIKTDSMKIPNATPDIVNFCLDFAKKYDYEFEHEAVFEKLCLVNGSTYIAKYMRPEECEKIYGYAPAENVEAAESNKLWTATATQFQVPYVFKTLFSHEEIIFKDMCETKSVKEGAIYLDMNEDLPDVSEQDKWLKKLDNLIPYFADPNYIPTKPSLKFIANLKEYYGKPEDTTLEDLRELLVKEIAAGHDYRFVGRVGQFTPIEDGHGGGILTCIRDGKPSAVTGTKRSGGAPYRWLESETVTDDDKNYIDRSYYRRLVDDAKEAIEEFGDFEWFVSDSNEPAPNFMNEPSEDIAE